MLPAQSLSIFTIAKSTQYSLVLTGNVLYFKVDKGTAGLNGTDGETTTQGKTFITFINIQVI